MTEAVSAPCLPYPARRPARMSGLLALARRLARPGPRPAPHVATGAQPGLAPHLRRDIGLPPESTPAPFVAVWPLPRPVA